MIPVRISLHGFLSYQEETILDLKNIHLACISGSNGSGKSSLLDAITWALFGQARQRDEAVINSNPKIKEAEVILDFEYEQNLYRVQRINPRGKTASLYFYIQTDNDDWKNLSENTIRETQTRIEEILKLDYDTFTNASFFLQGKADSFAEQRPSERKRILGSILGLDKWETYREKAAVNRRDSENKLKFLESQLDEIENELKEENDRKEKLRVLQQQIDTVSRLRKTRENELNQRKKLDTVLEEKKKSVQFLESRHADTIKGLDDIRKSLSKRKEEINSAQEYVKNEDQIRKDYDTLQTAVKELAELRNKREQLQKLQARQRELEILIDSEESKLVDKKKQLEILEKQYEQDQAQRKVLTAKEQELKEKLSVFEKSLSKDQHINEQYEQLLQEQSQKRSENQTLKTKMEEIKGLIGQLEDSQSSNCPLCQQPLDQHNHDSLIDTYTQNGKQLGDAYRENQADLKKLEQQLANTKQQMDEISRVKSNQLPLQREADQVSHQISTIDQRINEWQLKSKELAEISLQLENKSFAVSEREENRKIENEINQLDFQENTWQELLKQEKKLQNTQEDLRQLEIYSTKSESLSREILDLETREKAEKDSLKSLSEQLDNEKKAMQDLEKDLSPTENLEKELRQLLEDENKLRREEGEASQRVKVIDNLKIRKEQIKKDTEENRETITRFKLLEKAFGRDGIPALLIEQALPEIEEQANHLLDQLSSSGMTVRFETQQEYKDKKRTDRKETLDIIISDTAGQRDYAMYSGGEAFRVNFAIRLALSRVLANRAGARLQTLIIDEGFGSQDAEGRQKLVEAINLIQDDFEKILVITHLEELKEAFPSRIEVEKTTQGSKVAVLV